MNTRERFGKGPVAAGHACIWDEVFPVSVIAGFTSPAIRGDVEADMPAVFRALGKVPALAHMDQVHGAEVRTVESGGRYECDGIFTGLPELALVVRTADCLPLIFFSESKRVAGAVHMGWRSAAAGIIGNIPFDLSSFVCIAGVGLRSCCFRVSGDFLGQERTLPFTVRRGDASYFDPVEFARRSLIGRGLKQDCFYDAGICSYCSREGFHSHRKDGTADRTLSFIVRS